jgi:CubicO group peptidase (beta-lactamase class C family)
MNDKRSNQEKFSALLEYTKEVMEKRKVPGVAIGLIDGDEEYTAGLGVTSIEQPMDATPETLFQIGSTGKTFTCSVLMRLVEQGKLSLDDPVRKWIPQFKVQDEAAAAGATVRHLLDHTGGWVGDHLIPTGIGEDAIDKYVATMADLPQVFPLGMFFGYNNASFCVAGKVIEAVTGKQYESMVHELLFEPLEMGNTLYFPVENMEIMLHRFAAGHAEHEGKLILARPWGFDRNVCPAGGVVSDVHDMLKFARFHMGDGKNARGEQILLPETLRFMQTPNMPAFEDGWMGTNWFIKEIGGIRFVVHGGSTNGQKAAFWMAPEKKFALNVFTNQNEGGALHNDLSKWVREHFLGVREEEPTAYPLPVEQLAEYQTSFTMGGTGDLFQFAPDDGGLLTTMVMGDYSNITEVPPEPDPPAHCRAYEKDRFIYLDGPAKDAKVEFLRDEAGRIAWVRMGGRILARQQ